MHIQNVYVPQDTLCDIFSYLPPEDLFNAAQVCKSWNAALKPDLVWRNVARSILDLPEPAEHSWKEQCKALCRLQNCNPQVLSLSAPRGVYFFLEGSNVFELSKDYEGLNPVDYKGLYSVRNLLDNEEVCKINLKEHGCVEMVQIAYRGSMWAICDVRGDIYRFDLKSGQCLNHFIGKVALTHSSDSRLYVNDDDIILKENNRVHIWDLHECRPSQTFTIKEGQDILNICSTPNFVLCLCQHPKPSRTDETVAMHPSIFAINKNDPTIQPRIDVELPASIDTFNSSGSYCTLCVRAQGGQQVQVYEEISDTQFGLPKTYHLAKMHSEGLTMLKLYKNWAYSNTNYGFWIFDIRNGREIVFIRGNFGNTSSFEINSQALYGLTTIFPDERGLLTNKISLFDFSRRVRQISSPQS